VALQRLRIADVRCIVSAELNLASGRNYLIGANGAGKTSVLECIHLLGRGRSFRTRQAARLVRTGAAGFSVYGEISGSDLAGTTVSEGNHRLGIALSGGRLEARLDGGPAESLATLAQLFPVHVVDPRLHRLIESGPSERRRFIDAGVFHVEPTYLSQWRTYRRLLGQRNAALKAGHPEAVSGVWTEPLVNAGEAVNGLRTIYLQGLAGAVRDIGGRLLGCAVGLEFQSGWGKDSSFAEALRSSQPRDRASGYTQVGPHRADLQLNFDSGQVRDSASRGQQKLVAAALVLAQVREFERITGRRGTLLVDDPAAELDSESLQRLLVQISVLHAQSIITGLRIEPLQVDTNDPVFHVEQGEVKAVLY
jgi:DNA replication and repair protein RecF